MSSDIAAPCPACYFVTAINRNLNIVLYIFSPASGGGEYIICEINSDLSYFGRDTVNVTLSFSLSADIVPPCSTTISFAIASPSPAPPVFD